MRYYYDLHLHSCLSPCGDNEMTPNNIARMGMLAGYNLLALTDHNTCKNCPAFFSACRSVDIIPVAGMELTTAEDIHLVCLFPDLERAMTFDGAVSSHRILIPNRTDIFGDQWIMDGADAVIGSEPHLLSNATDLPLEEAAALAQSFGAACYPAHIDREGNGILAILGDLPDTPAFAAAEFHDAEKIATYQTQYPKLLEKEIVVCSDTHYLSAFPDAAAFFDWEETEEEQVIRKLIGLLSAGKDEDA